MEIGNLCLDIYSASLNYKMRSLVFDVSMNITSIAEKNT